MTHGLEPRSAELPRSRSLILAGWRWWAPHYFQQQGAAPGKRSAASASSR